MVFILVFLLLLWFFSYKASNKKDYLIMLPLLYSFVGLWGALGFLDNDLSGADWYIKDEHIIKTYFIFIIASVSFYLGSIPTLSKNKSGNLGFEKIRDIFFKLNDRYIILFYFFVVVFFHIAYPFEHLYFRVGYLPLYDGNNGLKLFFDFAVIILSIILPFFKSKIGRVFFFILLLILVQGLNKRIIVLLPLLYFLGSYLRDFKFHYLRFLILISVSIFFSGIAYKYRDNYEQGIISNIVYFYNNGVDFDGVLEGLNYLFGFSFFSTLVTYSFFDASLSDFLISINPLPSFILDVSAVVDKHKITVFAPYSALGTLGILGFTYVFAYYFAVGLIFGCCKNYFPMRFTSASFIVFVVFILFSVTSLQYQLRTATRFVYYAMFVFFIFKIVSVYFSVKKRPF